MLNRTDPATPPADAPRSRLLRIVLVLLGAAFGVALLGGAAWATPQPSFTSTPPDGGNSSPSWSWSVGPTVTRVDCRLSDNSGATVTATIGCGTSFTADLSAEPSGTYTLELLAYDSNGTASGTATDSLVYTASAPSFTSRPSSPGTATTVTWRYTGAKPKDDCTLEYGGVVVASNPNCGGQATFTLSSGDGPYTFTIVRNGSGASDTYVLDTTGPAVTLSGPAGPSSDRTPTFTLGGGESGASYACTLTAPGGSPTPTSCAPGSVSPTLTGPDGTYTLRATGTDFLGNVGATASKTYALDTGAPAAPGVTGPTGPSSNRNPVFTLSGEAGGTYSCTVTAPDSSTTTPACGAGSLTLNLPGPDGVYTLAVTQADAAGNRSAATTRTYDLQVPGPAAPTVTGPSGPSKDRRPVFTLSAEAGATFNCTVTTPSGTTFPVGCSGGTFVFDLTNGADGTYTGKITVTKNGKTSPPTYKSYTLDTMAPAAATVTGPTGPSNDRTPTFTVSGETGATYACAVTAPDGTTTTFGCAAGPVTTPTLAGADGTYTVSVTQTDQAGNAGPATTVAYVLDATPPAAPSVSGPSGPSADRAPTFTIAGEPGGSYSCTLANPDGSTMPVACSAGDVTLTLTSDGTYTLSVTQTDAAGNTSSAGTASYVLDATGPAAPSVTGPSGPSADRTPTFTITGEPGGSYSCTVAGPGGTSPVPCSAGDVTLSLGADGTYTLTVSQTDDLGNMGTATTRTYLLDTTAPAGPSVTGPTGPSADRTPTFTISGEPGGSFSCTVTAPDGSTSTVVCGSGDVTLSLGADGIYTLKVTQTDAAGNTSSARTRTYLLDTTAPAGPGVTGPTGPSADRTPTFTISGEPGGSFSCTVTAPDGATSTVVCAAGDVTLSLGADGTYTLSVTQTDAAGNTSSATTRTYLLDTTAPAGPGVTGPTGPSADRTPTFTISGEPGGSFNCTVTAPDGSTSTVVCGSGDVTLSLGADGIYTLKVTQTDAAGNTSSATTRTYLLDTTAPAGPGVTGPTGPSADRTPTFTISGEPGGSFSCTVTAPDGSTSTVVCGSGDVTLSLGADGIYTLKITQTDAAGNTSTVTSRTYVLDTTGPAGPGVTGPTGPSADRTPTFTISGEAGGSYSCTLTATDGSSSSVACSAGDVTLSLGADGSYTLSVTQTDAAGNASSATTRTYALDTTAPAGPAVTGPSGPSSDKTPTFTISGEPGGSYSCTVTAPNGSSSAVACSAGDLTLSLGADGTYTLNVTQTDAAGNTSSATTRTYVLDTTAPVGPAVTGPSGPSSDKTPTFTISGEPGGSYSCTVTAPNGSSSAVACSAGDLTLSLGADGTYTLNVTETDAAGNTSSTVTSRTYVLDTTAPTGPGVTGPTGPSSDKTPTFTISGEPGGSYSCTLTAPNGSSSTVVCGSGDVTLSLGADGIYTLKVTQTDAAGNTSSATTRTYLLDTTAPAGPGVTGPTGPSADRTPTFTISGEPGGSFSCTLTAPDGTVTSLACRAGNVTLDLQDTDGAYTLTVTQTDAAGNTGVSSAVPYELDTTPPTEPGLTGPPNGSSADRTPTFVVDGAPGDIFTCTLTAPDGTMTTMTCVPGPVAVPLEGQDGTYTFVVTPRDGAGNAGPQAMGTYVLDTTAPAAPTVTAAGPGEFELGTEDGARLRCELTGPDGTKGIVACDPGRFSLPASATPGTWTLTVEAIDQAGNTSPVTTRTYVVPAPEPGPKPEPEPEPGPVAPPAQPPTQPQPGPSDPRPDPRPAPPAPPTPPTPQATPDPAPAPDAPSGQQAEVVRVAQTVDRGVTQAAVLPVLPKVVTDLAEKLPVQVKNAPKTVERFLRLAVADGATARAFQRLGGGNGGASLGSRQRAMLRVLGGAATVGGIPSLLLMLVFLFLVLQDRIDRNDPKLALAPVHSHQELPFRPTERRLA